MASLKTCLFSKKSVRFTLPMHLNRHQAGLSEFWKANRFLRYSFCFIIRILFYFFLSTNCHFEVLNSFLYLQSVLANYNQFLLNSTLFANFKQFSLSSISFSKLQSVFAKLKQFSLTLNSFLYLQSVLANCNQFLLNSTLFANFKQFSLSSISFSKLQSVFANSFR